MNRILYISLLMLLVMFSNFTFAQIPLQVGNQWDFVGHEWNASGYSALDTLSLKIYADTTISGEKYYRITNNPWIYDFVRSDSIGVYFYDTLNSKEWLVFKFNLALGKYIQNGYLLSHSDTNNFIKVYKSVDDTTNQFGRPMRRMRFSIVHGIDNAYSVDISPLLGFIYIDASDLMYNRNINLMGCKISNQIFGTLTALKDFKQVPNKYKLFQNYPNPFNPTTTIKYQLPKKEIVTIKVYNILGKVVKTIIRDTPQNSGAQEVTFNGEGLSSGVYFYKLSVQGNSSSLFCKMVLLK